MKKNSMKKNRMLRLASTLMILTLLTTSIIGGTFAKYITTGSASDTARVAKWGVVINTSGSLYSDAYAANAATSGQNLPTAWVENAGADSITVATAPVTGDAKRDNIVAPGTKSAGDGLSFSISGKPEVAVKVKATVRAEDIFLAKDITYGMLVPAETVKDDASLQQARAAGVYVVTKSGTDITCAKVEDNATYDDTNHYYVLDEDSIVEFTDKDYFPVKYKLNDGAEKTVVEIAKEVAGKLGTVSTSVNETYKVECNEISHQYDANTDLAAAGPTFGDEKLVWEWLITDAADNKSDAKDTILGDLIAARATTANLPDYVVVSIAGDGTVTPLTFGTGDDYTVKNGSAVVANLQTKFDITLTVEQVD